MDSGNYLPLTEEKRKELKNWMYGGLAFGTLSLAAAIWGINEHRNYNPQGERDNLKELAINASIVCGGVCYMPIGFLFFDVSRRRLKEQKHRGMYEKLIEAVKERE